MSKLATTGLASTAIAGAYGTTKLAESTGVMPPVITPVIDQAVSNVALNIGNALQGVGINVGQFVGQNAPLSALGFQNIGLGQLGISAAVGVGGYFGGKKVSEKVGDILGVEKSADDTAVGIGTGASASAVALGGGTLALSALGVTAAYMLSEKIGTKAFNDKTSGRLTGLSGALLTGSLLIGGTVASPLLVAAGVAGTAAFANKAWKYGRETGKEKVTPSAS